MFGPVHGQTGDLRVVVSTSGDRLDPDGYVAALDTVRQSVSANGSAVFAKVTPGTHTASLLDLSEGCEVNDGNPRKFVIASGGIAEVRFEVVCSEPGAQLAPATHAITSDSQVSRTETPTTPTPAASDPIPIGFFAAGYWIGTLEPPGFASYPVQWTFYSEQKLGEVVGEAVYESPSPCSYDLILEFVGNAELVVAQQLVNGDCANGTRVILRRDEEKLWAYWLRPDKSAWFEAELSRISPNRP